MLRHPDVLPGLGDGGAHCGTICDGSYSTFTLMHWGRDRPTGRLPLPELVHGLCRATALTMGLNDRGLLAPGYKADINVIDFERLHLHPPEVSYDLPSGARRNGSGPDPRHSPASRNRPAFPNPILRPGAVYRSRTVWMFGTE